MNTQNTELGRLPATLELGPESCDALEGILPFTQSTTRSISVSRKDELLRLRERLFHLHVETTLDHPTQPCWPPLDSDIWKTARELERLVTTMGGPTLEWSMSFQLEFDERRGWAGVSEEWAFETLLQRAVSYIKPDFADRAIQSLAAAMHVATNPSARASWDRDYVLK